MSSTILDPAIAVELPDVLPARRARGKVAMFAYRHPSIFAGGLLVSLVVASAIFAPWLGTADPTALAPAKRLRVPSEVYWFGTDMLGRDIYSRVLYGTRVSLVVGLMVALFASVIGMFIGLTSGFVRVLDTVVMRVMDGLMSIPGILLAIALMALTRGSVQNVIIAITITEIPRVARLVRGQFLSLKEREFVQAARAVGAGPLAIIVRQLLPNALAPILVNATLLVGNNIILESVLSFFGFGVQPPTASWGTMLADGRAAQAYAPWETIYPGLAILLTVLSINLIGDGLRDALDPTSGGGGRS